MESTEPLHRERFHWQECRERLEWAREEHGAERIRIHDRRHAFEIVDEDAKRCMLIHAPLVLPILPVHRGIEDYLDEDLECLGLELVLLIQAGAVAMGVWEDGELMAHKAFKKYVVRGKGKAQATHLASKGKSRYGSRLRLQNWKSQILELKERAQDWTEAYGAFDHVLVSCPVRLWPEIFASDPEPPFDQREGVHAIPLDVAVPSHEELLRVRRSCERGVVESW